MSWYNFDNTYWYSFAKRVWFGVVLLSDLDKWLAWKIGIDFDKFSERDKFKDTNKWIIEFYDFNSNIDNIVFLYNKYFDVETNIDIKNNLVLLKKVNLCYSKLYDIADYWERISLIYWIDFINKDYTVYFRFYDLENLEKTMFFLSKISNEKYIIENYKNILNKIIKLKKFFNYFYLKIKYIDNWDFIYSVIFNFENFENEYSFEEYLNIIRTKTDWNMIKDLEIMYKELKFTEVSFNLKKMESENIAFFENNN